MVSPDTLPFMDPTAGIAYSSAEAGEFRDEAGLEAIRFSQEIRHLMAVPQENASSFTALLELPAAQAMDLLDLSESGKSPAASFSGDKLEARRIHSYGTLTFPSNPALMDRASRFSVAAKEQIDDVSPESTSILSNSCGDLHKVKPEPGETESSLPLVPDPTVNNQNQRQSNQNDRSGKRKEREKVKSLGKKSKTQEDADKLPYVHVRARRGQATDSPSLAERARREKINARMKLLQEIVPGCNKIQGTASVLDEIINHVQSLQRQVEVLSMRLATVNPRIDFSLDPILSANSGSLMDSSFSGTLTPMTWPEITGNRQIFQHPPQWPFDAFQNLVLGRGEDDYHNFIPSENSLSSDLCQNQVKMEL